MNLKYHMEASREIDEAFQWYEAQQPGLGFNFITEAESSVLRLLNFPNLNLEISKGIRRAILPVFPYGRSLFKKDPQNAQRSLCEF
jgi:toxin ParE1/3/4